MVFGNPSYPLCMSFSEHLRKWRKAKGLTQVELAQKLGMTQGVIAHYEKGIRKPDLDKVPAIAKILGVPVEAPYGVEGGKITRKAYGEPHRNRRVAKVQELYEKLSEDEQRFVLRQIKGLLGQAQK